MSGKNVFLIVVLFAVALCLTSGCESDSGGSSDSGDIGDNNADVYVALGDSITYGFGDAGTPYPDRLSASIGKTVVNEGSNAETSGGGASRVNGVLSKHSPARLLVLYGANDVIHSRSQDDTINNLRYIIQAAKGNNTTPEIATLIPMPGHSGQFSDDVVALNDKIKALAGEEGVRLVDLYSAFPGPDGIDAYMQSDGVHPNDAGTQIIADSFR